MQKDKKEAKRLYDMEYRRKKGVKLKILKAERYQRDRHKYVDREKEYRQKTSDHHNAYCMQPEYVKKKRIWDVVYRNMKIYGEFWESAILVNQLEIEIRNRIPRNERASTKRCVKANSTRNSKRRLDKAINQIMHGDANMRILSYGWIDESKQLLETLFIK